MHPQEPRTLSVCADDFGLTPGISAAITRLARANCITAISCITNSPYWESSAPLLCDLPESVDVGLHINLTEGKPLSAQLAEVWPSLPALQLLMVRAHLHLLPLAALASEVQAQVAAFSAATGGSPRYLDGHQHVHHLPGLREIVLEAADRLRPTPAIRNTGRVLGPGFGVKRWLIENTGAQTLRRELARRGLDHNPVLLGAYDFQDANYRGRMQGWLAALPAGGGLLFCHPGEVIGGDPPDAINPARARELAYLESDAFLVDRAAANVRLGRVWQKVQAALLPR
jgi:predicted glycoside hydrolase/deacetylase ChbG (UPF0249 family)